MPQPDRAWWDDVQYLREPLERKREKEARRGLRLDARAAARAVAERQPPPRWPRPSWTSSTGSTPSTSSTPCRARAASSAPRPTPTADAPTDDAGRQAARPPLRALRPSAARRFARSERDAGAAHGARRDRAPEAPAAAAPTPLSAPSRRRTVEITGRTVGAPSLPRLVQIDRRRPARRATERVGARPDRLALWAVVLGFFLIFVAVTSTSHAATRAHSAGAASGRVVHQQVFHAHTAALRAIPPAR